MAQLLLASSSLTAAAPASLAEALARVEARLDAWAANSTAYNNLLLQVFAAAGTEPALWQRAAAELQATLQSSGLAISLELLSSAELPGITGAYTAQAPGGGERLYLNAAWLQSASAAQIEGVLLEELGHAIDKRLNGTNDSPGDEGERFSALLRGLVPSAASFSEDDQRQITLLGQPLLVEAADTTAPRLDLTGFRNPAFAGAESAFGLPDVGDDASPTFVDIDGDGDLDAFIGEYYGNNLFFENTAAPGATAPSFAAPTSTGALAVVRKGSSAFADLNGDGDLDAFIGSKYGETFLRVNIGNALAPTFAAGASSGIPIVGFSSKPAFADIDADGDFDAFIGNRDGTTLFFRNNGSAAAPSFAGSASAFGLPNVGANARPTFADSDGDGDLDAFIGNRDGNTLFFRNTGNATAPAFAGSASAFGLPDVGWSASPAFADIDGDGDLDAFIGNEAGNTLFFRNIGGGIFSTNPNGAYAIGSVITIALPFSEVVFVTGSPRLRLQTGAVDRVATFTGGSGTRVLTFSYTVQAGDTSADLDLVSAAALELNGGTIRDAAGNSAVLTLPAPGSTGSLGANADLVIDGVVPRVDLSGFRNPAFAGSTIAFGFPVVGANARPSFVDIDGDGDLDAFIGNQAGSTLFFRNTGNVTAPAFAASTSAFGLPDVGSFARPAFADSDGDGDLDAFIGSGSGNTLFFRNTGNAAAPAFAGSTSVFGSTAVTVRAIPALVDIDGDGDLDAFVGELYGRTLFFRNTGSATSPAFAGSSIGFGFPDVGLSASPAFADIDGDGDLDAFIGNQAGSTLFFGNTGSGGLSSPNPNGTYGVGSVITIELPFTEAVFVDITNGIPTLRLATGSTDRVATFISGSGTKVLRFTYTVQVGDSSADLDLRSANALELNGGTIRDVAGNTAVLTLPAPGSTGSLGANADLVIDGDPRSEIALPRVDLSGFRNPAFAAAASAFGLPDVGTDAIPAFADSDGDGDLDAFIGEGVGSTLFFRNTGNAAAPAFAGSASAFALAGVGSNASPSFVDIDADGDLDAFIGNRDGITLFFNNTAAPGASAPSFAGSASAFGLPDVGSNAIPAFADTDGDGDLDVFIGNGAGFTLFFQNTGNATAPAFASSASAFGLPAVGSFAKPTFADTDGDGDFDAFIGNGAGNTLFFQNTGNAAAPAFAGSASAFGLPSVGRSASPAFADIDGDGDLDAFVGEYYGTTFFSQNTASGGISSTNPNGTYGIGSVITIELPFSEIVFVTGSPRLLLETGNTDRFATFTGGSGSRVLTFSYTVEAGDRSADLDLVSADALELNGGTIRDAAGNNAVLSLLAPGTTGSLGATADLVINGGPGPDTTAPRLDLSGFRNPAFAGSASAFGLPGVGNDASLAFADSDGDGDLDAFIGNRLGNTLFFRNTAAPGASAPAFAASASAFGLADVGSNASPSFVDIDGDGDLDAFIGNRDGSTLFFNNTAAPGTFTPAFAGSASAFGLPDVGTYASPAFADIDGDGDLDAFIGERFGNTLFFQNTGNATAPAFAGSASAFGLRDVGSFAKPTFADSDGDGDLDAFIGNVLGTTLFFRNTGSATAPTFAASASAFGLADVGIGARPSFVDIDGDGDLDAFIGSNKGSTLFFRNTGSGGITSTNPNGTYGIGSVITIELPFSEVVFVTGSPRLLLETGSTDRFATFSGGSGTRVLTFTYTVQAGDTSADLELRSANALELNDGTILDAAGNSAVLTLPAPGSTGSLGANADLVIDGIAPSITAGPSPTGSSDISVTSNEAGTASLVTADNSQLFTTALAANTAATLTLAAQALVTTATLKVADTAGNLTSSAPTFLLGTVANDTIAGTAAADFLYAFDGNDILTGADGIDTLIGGDGNDAYAIETNGDLVIETNSSIATGGIDTVLSSLTTYTLTDNVENLTLTGAAINGNGNTLNNLITGNNAANSLNGGNGIDTLNGGAGIDTLAGGDGRDIYFIETSGDLVVETNPTLATGGNDTVVSSLTTYTLNDNVENLTLIGPALNGTGNSLNNLIRGNASANSLYGGNGNDFLIGGSGINTLTGGEGSDTYIIESSGDLVVETNSSITTGGIDTVLSSLTTYTLNDNVENLTLTGAAINGNGNTLNNLITGNNAANSLNGGNGIDTLNGGAGIDTLAGGDGRDIYFIETSGDLVVETNPTLATGGNDTVVSSLTTYTLNDNVENLTLIGPALNGTGNSLNNLIRGNASANSLSGDNGNDFLIGGGGIDTLTGGLGADTFLFDSDLNASTNRDLITDFTIDEGDLIQLENSVFTTLTTIGTLAPTAFAIGAAATTADHRILYDSATGLLAFVSNGDGGSTAIAFATLTPGLALTSSQFTVT